MLQATNARTLPMQMNSVRHIEPWRGTIDPYQLLDAHIGTHYVDNNNFLRSSSYKEGFAKMADSIKDNYYLNKGAFSRPRANAINYQIENPEEVASQLISAMPEIEKAVMSNRQMLAHPSLEPENYTMAGASLHRGISFKTPEEADRFLQQYEEGAIIEQPGFTSTTIDEDVADRFTSYHNKNTPDTAIKFQYYPSKTTGAINAYNVSDHPNAYELNEWMMPPNSRVKVLSVNPPDGVWDKVTRVMLQDATGELTTKEQTAKNILGRMKPRLANLAKIEPEPGHKIASFEQRPDGYVQSYVNQEPYKLLTQEEAQVAIDKLRPNPQWQISQKNM